MCTAATYKTKDFYMGRTLDYEFSYGEQITITPRNYEFDFRFAGKIKSHYALIGMAFVAEGYPLYYDAVNEKGLGMAGLNFVGNAAYEEALPEDETEVSQVAQFEFIPWILVQCATVEEVREKLEKWQEANEKRGFLILGYNEDKISYFGTGGARGTLAGIMASLILECENFRRLMMPSIIAATKWINENKDKVNALSLIGDFHVLYRE